MIIKADFIITGNKLEPTCCDTLLIKDGIIEDIGSFSTIVTQHPDEELTIYEGMTILPGMIDLHVHLDYIENPAYYNELNGQSLRAFYVADRMKRTLKAGVTTVRDASSSCGIGTAVKKAAADGLLAAPRVFACLQGICMTGGHGADDSPIGQGIIEADGVDEIRKAVRLNLKRGADCIKVLTSEGYRGEELNFDELKAAAEEAHRFGKKAAAHAGYGASLEQCIRAGFDSIEHGTHLTVEQAIYMKDHDITWVPTIFVFNLVNDTMRDNPESFAELLQQQGPYLEDCVRTYKENVRALYDTGVRVATGTDTDCTGYPGASPVYKECEYLVQCGLTPVEAIECATKNGADYLGLGDRLGQVKKGYIADLVVVQGNPYDDIKALSEVRGVFQNGNLLNL